DILKQYEVLTDLPTFPTRRSSDLTATEVVTLTITGTNDAPMITTAAGQDAGAVSEAGVNPGNTAFAGTPSASGTLTSSDVDHGATGSWNVSTTSTYGACTINAATR